MAKSAFLLIMKLVYFLSVMMRVEAVTMTRMWNGFGTVEKLCVLDICVHFCKNWFFVLSCMNFVCMNLKLVYINCRTK